MASETLMAVPTPKRPTIIPSVRERRLADLLHEYRDQAHLSLSAVAARTGLSRATIGHKEKCLRRFTVADVRQLLGVYGVTGPEADAVLALARESRQRSWWMQYNDIFHGPFIALEDAANGICDWSTRLPPGLFQTREVATEIIMTAGGFSPADVDRRVDARMLRQKLLSRPDAPAIHAILDEAILHRPLGAPAVWREQLHRLVRESSRPNVTIQVLAARTGIHAGLNGPFTVFRFPEPADPDVGFCEGPFGAVYLEGPQKVAACNLVFGRLSDAALNPEESAALIGSVAAQL